MSSHVHDCLAKMVQQRLPTLPRLPLSPKLLLPTLPTQLLPTLPTLPTLPMKTPGPTNRLKPPTSPLSYWQETLRELTPFEPRNLTLQEPKQTRTLPVMTEIFLATRDALVEVSF